MNLKKLLIKDIEFITTLTKKMAEDLTEYLHENGLKVRYMQPDIDTLGELKS